MKTSVCDLFGIDVPIFAFSHCRDVVAAVSLAGGMGVLGAASYHPEELETELSWIDEHVKGRPYGVDVLMADTRVEGTLEELQQMIPSEYTAFVESLNQRFGIPELREDAAPLPPGSIYKATELRGTHGWARAQLQVAFEHPISLMVSALGAAPADVAGEAHRRGIRVGGLVGAGRHARKQIDAGADILVAAGNEGGGHNSDIATMVLVPEVVKAAEDVPVLAAGGIGSGSQIAAGLALGAEGVWLGSVWLATVESDLDDKSVEKLLRAGSHDTVRTKCWSGKPTRFLRDPWIDGWEEPGSPEPLPTPLQRILVAPSQRRAVSAGMTEIASVPVGEVVGQMTQRRRVRDIMVQLQQEYLDAVTRLQALSGLG